MRKLLMALSLVSIALPAAAQNVKAGIEAWQKGDTAGAVAIWRPLAEKGDPDEARALLIVGTALYNGDGVQADPVTAYAYVSRAAAQGLAPAQATLADMDAAMPLD